MPWMSTTLLRRRTDRAERPERTAAGVPWKTTEDIPHTGISVDVALGHDGSLLDRTGGLR